MNNRLPQEGLQDHEPLASVAHNDAMAHSLSSLPHAFARAAGWAPNKAALVQGEERWSYADLDRLSGMAASRLASMGVARGRCVGIFMDRSAEAVIAMLAILRIGGVYVPFDPAAPTQRLAAQARAAAIAVLIVAGANSAPVWFEGKTLVIDARATEPATPIHEPDLHPLELAYVIYTSGSTNEAKGVCVTHRAILDLIFGADYCGFVADDVVYHGMSIAFDGATFEIWGALLTGGTLVIAPPKISAKEIADLVESNGVTVLLLSTGVFNALGREALQRLRHVRVLLAGGDVMSPASAEQFLALGGRAVVNGYGPTEVTTFSHCRVMTTTAQTAGAIPIGAPIPGTSAYVLDEGLDARSLGIEGELFIAGTGLAQGYLDNPALTAERFLPDPFANDGSRMYRTGDLVTQDEGSILNYVGRIDTQVKIRGFRVELGEIETCLRTQADLADACVVHVKNAAEASVLYAFAVPEDAAAPLDGTTLLNALRKVLPDYMIPRGVDLLAALPLTINGKVDRRKLADRALAAMGTEDPVARCEASSDALERSLLDQLGHLLGQAGIRADDNFFDVGGDSLAAMRFCALVGEQHGIDLPLIALFEADSLKDVIKQVRALTQEHAPRVEAV
jgi:amino acid adenylation domain-containing protein